MTTDRNTTARGLQAADVYDLVRGRTPRSDLILPPSWDELAVEGWPADAKGPNPLQKIIQRVIQFVSNKVADDMRQELGAEIKPHMDVLNALATVLSLKEGDKVTARLIIQLARALPDDHPLVAETPTSDQLNMELPTP